MEVADLCQTTLKHSKTLKLFFEKTFVSFFNFARPVQNWTPTCSNERQTSDQEYVFFSNVAACYCSIHCKYHIFSGFIFKTCNLQLLSDVVAVELDAAVGIKSQDHLGLGMSLPGMKVKRKVLTGCLEHCGEISEQPPFSPLLWGHATSLSFCQAPSLI